MKELYYISRNFTEFGGFTAQEILDFNGRGLLRSSDYVRLHDTDDWVHLNDWVAPNAATPPPAVTAKPKAKIAKKAAAKPKAKKAVKPKE
jgi:hypothetical protein